MEIIGDDKRLRALYSETRFGDEQVAPGFSATWHRAQSRAKQPRRVLNFAFASSLTLAIFAIATFAIWTMHSPQPQPQTYAAFASAAANMTLTTIQKSPQTGSPVIPVNFPNVPRKSRANRLAARREQLMVAENRQTEKDAKEIASWQSPTASLLSSSSDDLFKSLPQLNENANEMKSFLPNRSNDKEN